MNLHLSIAEAEHVNAISFHGGSYLANILLKYLRAPDHPMKVRIFRYIAKRLFPKGFPVQNRSRTNLS
jgi:hypothetical protein